MDVLDDEEEQAALEQKSQLSKQKGENQENQFQKTPKQHEYSQSVTTNQSKSSSMGNVTYESASVIYSKADNTSK